MVIVTKDKDGVLLTSQPTICRCGKDPRLDKEGCKYVCTACGGLWGEVGEDDIMTIDYAQIPPPTSNK